MRAHDHRDLLFQLWEVAGLESRLAGTDLDRAAVEGILDTADRIAAEHFLPHGRLVDEAEPRFEGGRAVLPDVVKAAVDAHAGAGFIAAGFDPAHGGMGLPETVHMAASFIFAAANVSLSGYAMLTVGAGRLIQSFGSAEQKRRCTVAHERKSGTDHDHGSEGWRIGRRAVETGAARGLGDR